MPVPIKSALGPFQQAVYTLLTGNAAFMAKAKGLYDQVPEPPVFPYVTIGPDREKPWLTQGRLGRQIDIQFEIWSRYQGFKEAEDIADLLIAALDHATLTVTGFPRAEAVLGEVGSRTREPDGLTREIPVYFVIHLEQA